MDSIIMQARATLMAEWMSRVAASKELGIAAHDFCSVGPVLDKTRVRLPVREFGTVTHEIIVDFAEPFHVLEHRDGEEQVFVREIPPSCPEHG